MLNAAASEFLEERGLDLEVVARFEPTSRRPNGVSDGEWIAFPFFRADQIVNREYRCIEPKQFRRDKGGAMCFWNEVVLDDPGLADEPLIITEGIMDALSIIQAGFQRVVSMPNGSQSADPSPHDDGTPPRYRFLADVQSKLDRIGRIILATDADAKGYALCEDLATLLGPARCKFVPYPDHCKDANDVLVRKGADALRECVVRARWVNVAGVRKFSDYPPGSDADPIVWRPAIHPSFDRRCGIMPGYSSVWTGIPNNGKSTLLNQVKWSLCQTQPDFRAAMAMLEIMPNRDYRRQALQYLIGRPRDGGPNGHPWTDDEVREANDWLDEHVIPIDPNGYHANGVELEEVEATMDWFLDAAQTAIVRYGARFVALDPWGDIIQIKERGESEHDWIGRSLSRINRLARTLKAHIAIVAHPRKIEPGRGGNIRAPGPYEIAGSSYFFNKASLGVTVHRDPELDADGTPIRGDTRTSMIFWKSKFHDVQGPPGQLYLRFNPSQQRFEGP